LINRSSNPPKIVNFCLSFYLSYCLVYSSESQQNQPVGKDGLEGVVELEKRSDQSVFILNSTCLKSIHSFFIFYRCRNPDSCQFKLQNRIPLLILVACFVCMIATFDSLQSPIASQSAPNAIETKSPIVWQNRRSGTENWKLSSLCRFKDGTGRVWLAGSLLAHHSCRSCLRLSVELGTEWL
jgi:hypothetical protein